jgi:hypothetical protein
LSGAQEQFLSGSVGEMFSSAAMLQGVLGGLGDAGEVEVQHLAEVAAGEMALLCPFSMLLLLLPLQTCVPPASSWQPRQAETLSSISQEPLCRYVR